MRAQVHIGRVGIVRVVPQSDHPLEPPAGSEGQPDDRGVATAAEVLASTRSAQTLDLLVRQDEYRLSGMIGGRILTIGDPLISPSSSSRLKSCCCER
jgi:hypothetical protein